MINKDDFEQVSTKRLILNGESKDWPTYKVPIDLLYYNDENGRIAATIDEYDAAHDDVKLMDLFRDNREKYNEIIGEYIIASANDKGKSFKKTTDDIREKGQQVPGVILTDGRIIDGNRRFTALRKLSKEKGINSDRFKYFECAILEVPNQGDERGWNAIKNLEIFLQDNKDKEVDYDPIERLAAFYKAAQRISQEEYCKASGIGKSDYKKQMDNVEVALDYLKWLGLGDTSFYLLKPDKLDGPLKEIAKKWPSLNMMTKQKVRDYVYPYMTFAVSGNDTDLAKNNSKKGGNRSILVRRLLEGIINNNEFGQTFVEEVDKPEVTTKLQEAVQDKVEINTNKSRNIETNIDKRKVVNSMAAIYVKAFNNARFKQDTADATSEPLNNLKQANDLIKKAIEDKAATKGAIKASPDDFERVIGQIETNIEEIKNLKDE